MNLPQSPEGASCVRAAEAAVSAGGMGPASVDIGSALALAGAYGVPPRVAAPLLAAAAEGVRAGIADRKEGEP